MYIFDSSSVGKKTDIFSEKAFELIHAATGGNPRQINILCDTALLAAYSRGRVKVDEKIIRECVEKLHIPGDQRAFYLPPERSSWKIWLMLGAVVVALEGIAVAYSYHRGWLQLLWTHIRKTLNLD
jgi:general secretion pathway protein A